MKKDYTWRCDCANTGGDHRGEGIEHSLSAAKKAARSHLKIAAHRIAHKVFIDEHDGEEMSGRYWVVKS